MHVKRFDRFGFVQITNGGLLVMPFSNGLVSCITPPLASNLAHATQVFCGFGMNTIPAILAIKLAQGVGVHGV